MVKGRSAGTGIAIDDLTASELFKVFEEVSREGRSKVLLRGDTALVVVSPPPTKRKSRKAVRPDAGRDIVAETAGIFAGRGPYFSAAELRDLAEQSIAEERTGRMES